MEKDSKIKILYRTSEKSSKTSKIKPSWISNEVCIKNISKERENAELIIFGDRLNETKQIAKEVSDIFLETKKHGNANTFLEILDYAVDNLDPECTVIFSEDDYIYRPGFIDIVKEGLEKADYISLYFHPDRQKHQDGLGIFYTKSTYWQYVTSTTMSFATKVNTLIYDYQIFKQMCEGQDIPPDYYIWNHLVKEKGRRLANPIPSWCTHGEVEHLAPIINWQKYL